MRYWLFLTVIYFCTVSCDTHEKEVLDSEDELTHIQPAPGVHQETHALQNSKLFYYRSDDGATYEIEYGHDEKGEPHAKIIEGTITGLLEENRSWAKGAEYTNGKITLNAQGNVAEITYEGKQVGLVLTSPIVEIYSHGEDKVRVTYHDTDEGNYVMLDRMDGKEIMLNQSDDGDKGTLYTNGDISWTSDDQNYSLVENGKKVNYQKLK